MILNKPPPESRASFPPPFGLMALPGRLTCCWRDLELSKRPLGLLPGMARFLAVACCLAWLTSKWMDNSGGCMLQLA
jgi:hypothetical protein